MEKKKLHKHQGEYYSFFCPGCKQVHTVDNKWNIDLLSVTISPSVLTQHPRKDASDYWRCHSFVREGKIQFLNDCSHELKGETVDLPLLEMDEDGAYRTPEDT